MAKISSLLPCPRCGGQPLVEKGKPYATYWTAYCPVPHGIHERRVQATPMPTKASAIDTWNDQVQRGEIGH